MNPKIQNAVRLPSLLLAAALQVLPIVRAALPVTQSAANLIIILFRWGGAAAAALGGVQAVSGGSTVITNPLTSRGTNGQSFSLRLTTAPDQAHYWQASGLPLGLNLTGTSGSALWSIQGTPTSNGTYSVALTAKDQANSGASRTVNATLTLTIVSPPSTTPSITSQPANRTTGVGGSASFTVSASGPAPLTYQWRFNTVNVGNATNATLALTGVTTNDAGAYDVVVRNNSGSVTSTVATLTVTNVPTAAPSIVSHPVSQTVPLGGNATFSVSALGTPPLTYQWRFNSGALSGATNSTLPLLGVTGDDAGGYDVIVQNNSGSVTSVVALLTVTNPPVSLALGVYNGLFFNTNSLTTASAGFFNAKTLPGRAVIGSLRLGVSRIPFKGLIDGDGQAAIEVRRNGLNPLALTFRTTERGLTGLVSDGVWTSPLRADLAVYNLKTNPATSLAGLYTALLPGAEENTGAPIGDGIAALKVDAGGNLTLAGSLADGSRLVQKGPVSFTGEWPLYAPVPQNGGAILGWLRVRPSNETEFDGETYWIRPAGRNPKVHTNGFLLASTVLGSAYVSPGTNQMLPTATANLIFTGGNLADSITNVLAFGPAGRVTNLSPNKLTLKFNTKLGLIAGVVSDPASLKPVKFQAVLLPTQQLVGGSFLGTNEVGRVELAAPR